MIIPLWSEIKDIVGIEIQYQPDQDDHTKNDKTGAVFDLCKKWDQEDPEDRVIYKSNDGKRMGVSLFDDLSIPCLIFELSEPLGSMGFDANSIHHADQGQPDQTSLCGPERSRESKQYINQCWYTQYQGEYVIPANSKKFFFCHLVSPLFYSGHSS